MPFIRGIPLPGRGIVGKNQSARSKTTVRSKRVFPLRSGGGPFTLIPSCRMFIFSLEKTFCRPGVDQLIIIRKKSGKLLIENVKFGLTFNFHFSNP